MSIIDIAGQVTDKIRDSMAGRLDPDNGVLVLGSDLQKKIANEQAQIQQDQDDIAKLQAQLKTLSDKDPQKAKIQSEIWAKLHDIGAINRTLAQDIIDEQTQEYQPLFDQIASDQAKIDQDHADIANLEADIKTLNSSYEGDANKAMGDIFAILAKAKDILAQQDDIKACAEKLKDSEIYGSLANAILACYGELDAISQTLKNDSQADLAVKSQEQKRVGQYLKHLVSALLDKYEIQKLSISIQKMIDNDADSSEINAQMSLLQDKRDDLDSHLSTVFSMIDDDIQQYAQDRDDADLDQNGIRWFDYLAVWNAPSLVSRNSHDGHVIDNKNSLISKNEDIKAALIGEFSLNMSAFQDINIMLQLILKKIAKLRELELDPKKNGQSILALGKEIMTLFVQVMGLIDRIQETVMRKKSSNEELMAKATSRASEMSMHSSMTQEKKIQQDTEYLSFMNTFLNVTKYVLMGLALLFVPGVGGFLVTAALIGLELGGVTDKLVNALKPIMGEIGAEVFVTALEVIATMGGGAAIDMALKAAMKNVIAALGENFVRQAVQNAAREADVALSQEVETFVTDATKQAAEMAAKKAAIMYMRQNGMKLVLEMLSQTAKGNLGSATDKMIENVMQTAAKDAADQVAKRSIQYIEENGSQQVLEAFEKNAITRKIVSDANSVADSVMGESGVAKNVNPDSPFLSTAGNRGLLAAGYGMLANNVPIDLAKSIHGNSKDKSFDDLMNTLQMIEGILAAIMQAWGTGLGRQLSGLASDAQNMLMKGSNYAMAISEGTNTYGNATSATTKYSEADAVAEVQKIKAAINVLLQMISPQIEHDRKEEAKRDLSVLTQEMQSTSALAAHSFDNLSYQSEILVHA